MFKQLVGQSAVVRRRGVFLPCDLYEYRGMMFAKVGSGFIRLTAKGDTSQVGTEVDMLAYDGPLFSDKFGRLAVADGGGYTALIAQPDGTITPLQLEGPK